MGQHICFGAMCDIVANSHINVTERTFTQNTVYMDIICRKEHRAMSIYNILGIQKWFSHK